MKSATYYSVTKKQVELRAFHELASYKLDPWYDAVRVGDKFVNTRSIERTQVPVQRYSKMDSQGNVHSVYAAIDDTLLELMGCAKVDFDREMGRINLRDEKARKHSFNAKRFEEALRGLTLWGRIKWAFKPVYCRE